MREFKSEAHKAKLAELVKDGKISQRDFDSHAKATGRKKLPTRISQPKGSRR